MIWFTSDLHLGHRNILKYCSRPYTSIEEHDRDLVRRWNERVKDQEPVYVLGDFAFVNGEKAEAYLKKLRGQKILVRGNHDSAQLCNAKGWSSVWRPDGAKANPIVSFDREHYFLLSHYSMDTWIGQEHGVKLLHGHSHGTSTPAAGRIDVGVDCWGYAPVSLSELMKALCNTSTTVESPT